MIEVGPHVVVLNVLYYTPVLIVLALLSAASGAASCEGLKYVVGYGSLQALLFSWLLSFLPLVLSNELPEVLSGWGLGIGLAYYITFCALLDIKPDDGEAQAETINELAQDDQYRYAVGEVSTYICFQSFDLVKDVIFLSSLTSLDQCNGVLIVTGIDAVLSVVMLVEIFIDAKWTNKPRLGIYLGTVLQHVVFSVVMLIFPSVIQIVAYLVVFYANKFVAYSTEDESDQAQVPNYIQFRKVDALYWPISLLFLEIDLIHT